MSSFSNCLSMMHLNGTPPKSIALLLSSSTQKLITVLPKYNKVMTPNCVVVYALVELLA